MHSCLLWIRGFFWLAGMEHWGTGSFVWVLLRRNHTIPEEENLHLDFGFYLSRMWCLPPYRNLPSQWFFLPLSFGAFFPKQEGKILVTSRQFSVGLGMIMPSGMLSRPLLIVWAAPATSLRGLFHSLLAHTVRKRFLFNSLHFPLPYLHPITPRNITEPP